MQRKLSSAYHPQTDGQTERTNRTIEEMLRNYISPRQDDWHAYLPLIQFAINNAPQWSTRHTPFFLNHHRHPRVPMDLLAVHAGQPVPRRGSAQGADFAREVERTLADAKLALKQAQERMLQQMSRHVSPVVFERGQLVLLSTRNLRLRQGVRKLMPRWVGPFEIFEVVGGSAAKLILTEGYERLFPVFHFSLLKPYRGDKRPVRPLPVNWEDGEPVYEVSCIKAHQPANPGPGKRVSGYFVSWHGYGADEDSWEPARNLSGCDELLDDYWRALGKCIVGARDHRDGHLVDSL